MQERQHPDYTESVPFKSTQERSTVNLTLEECVLSISLILVCIKEKKLDV